MSTARSFELTHLEARRRALVAVQEAEEGWSVLVSPPRMNDGQKRRFHAICGDFSKSALQWAGKRRTAKEWKLLLISGHATATGEEVDFVPGLEGEFVNLRESTTQISRRRGSSLIEYATAYATQNGVRLNDPRLRELEEEADRARAAARGCKQPAGQPA